MDPPVLRIKKILICRSPERGSQSIIIKTGLKMLFRISTGESLFQTLQRRLQYASRATDIQAHVSFPAGSEYAAVVQGEPGFVDKEGYQFGLPEGQLAAIHPDEEGGFGAVYFY